MARALHGRMHKRPRCTWSKRSLHGGSSSRASLMGRQCASVFATSTLGTIGLAVGGAAAMLAQGSAAFLRGAAAGAAAASSSGAVQPALASPVDMEKDRTERSASPRAVDSKGKSEHVGPPVPPVPTGLGHGCLSGPERRRRARLTWVAGFAFDASFCVACHTDNLSHLAHL